MKHWTDKLRDLTVCPESIEWAGDYPTFAEAWSACQRADWMLWLVGRLAGEYTPELRLAACACARTVLHLVPEGEERPRIAIETAERYARGKATEEEFAAARDAVMVAARDVVEDDDCLAFEAAWGTASDHEADVQWAGKSQPAQNKELADLVRSMIPCPDLDDEQKE